MQTLYVELPIVALVARPQLLLEAEDQGQVYQLGVNYYVVHGRQGELPISRRCFQELFELAVSRPAQRET